MASFIIISFVGVYIYLGFNEFLKVAENNFEDYKCDPRYIFFNGYIKPKEGEDGFQSTGDYFQECVQPLAAMMAKQSTPKLNSLVSGLASSAVSAADNLKDTNSGLNSFNNSFSSEFQKKQDDDNKETQNINDRYIHSRCNAKNERSNKWYK